MDLDRYEGSKSILNLPRMRRTRLRWPLLREGPRSAILACSALRLSYQACVSAYDARNGNAPPRFLMVGSWCRERTFSVKPAEKPTEDGHLNGRPDSRPTCCERGRRRRASCRIAPAGRVLCRCRREVYCRWRRLATVLMFILSVCASFRMPGIPMPNGSIGFLSQTRSASVA
jgi:hypothetical protein